MLQGGFKKDSRTWLHKNSSALLKRAAVADDSDPPNRRRGYSDFYNDRDPDPPTKLITDASGRMFKKDSRTWLHKILILLELQVLAGFCYRPSQMFKIQFFIGLTFFSLNGYDALSTFDDLENERLIKAQLWDFDVSKLLRFKRESEDYGAFTPQHVHLSYGVTVQEIIIMWATKDICSPEVVYGTHPWGFESTKAGQSYYFHEYNEQGLQYVHRTELKNLQSQATHYYKVHCNSQEIGPFYFKVPKRESDWSPDFLIFGDLGIHSSAIPSLLSAVLSGNYTAVFHVGDIAYDLKDVDGKVGDYYMKLIEPVASSVPYMTCPGNHEIDNNTFTHYRLRFSMPGTEWPIPINKMWYSIDIGPVHFISYSSEVFFTNQGIYERDQIDWLIKDLKSANEQRSITPWIIAFGHRPMYCTTHIGDDCSLPDSLVRQGFEEVFKHFQVDIVIQAHEHNYERLWPMYKGNVTQRSYNNPDVPVQIITGAGGSREGVDQYRFLNIPEWSAFRLDNTSFNSFGRLLVVNKTHALWEQRSALEHILLDSIWITKERDFSSAHKSNMNFDNKTVVTDDEKKSFIATHILAIGVSVVGLVCVVIAVIVLRVLVKRRRNKYNAVVWNVNTDDSTYMKSLVSNDSDEEFQ